MRRKLRWLVFLLSSTLFVAATLACRSSSREAAAEAAADALPASTAALVLALASVSPAGVAAGVAAVVFAQSWGALRALRSFREHADRTEERYFSNVAKYGWPGRTSPGRAGIWGFLAGWRLLLQLVGAAGAAWSAMGLGLGAWVKGKVGGVLTRARSRRMV